MNRPRTRRRPRPRFGRAGLQGHDAQSLLPAVHQSLDETPSTDDEYEDDFSARYEPKRRFDCLIKRMSRIACLVAVSVLLVEMLFSQQTPKLVAFDTLL